MCYSRSNPNQVVWHYAELGKVGEGVYTYLQQKDQYREEDDMIAIVLQLEDVFFEYGTYSRRFLADKDVAAAGAEVLKNFHRTIEQTMQEGRHLQLLLVRIYEELGLDAAPLIRYREERQLFSFKASNGGAETPERAAAATSRRAAARTVTVGRDQVPRWGIHLQREFYRAVQIQADSHTASHTRNPVPKRNRTLPRQYLSLAHEKRSQA